MSFLFGESTLWGVTSSLLGTQIPLLGYGARPSAVLCFSLMRMRVENDCLGAESQATVNRQRSAGVLSAFPSHEEMGSWGRGRHSGRIPIPCRSLCHLMALRKYLHESKQINDS